MLCNLFKHSTLFTLLPGKSFYNCSRNHKSCYIFLTEHEWRTEMPKSIYEDIYKDLKMKIEDNILPIRSFCLRKHFDPDLQLLPQYSATCGQSSCQVTAIQTMRKKVSQYLPSKRRLLSPSERSKPSKESAAKNGQNAHTGWLYRKLCISKNQSAYRISRWCRSILYSAYPLS